MTEARRRLLPLLVIFAATACVEILDPLRQPYIQDFLIGPYSNSGSSAPPVLIAAGRRITVSGDFQLPVGDCMSYKLEPDVAVPVRARIGFLIHAVSTGEGMCEFPAWVHYEAILGEFEEGPAMVTIVHRVGSTRTEVFRGEVQLR
jgi:hypothetical protein